MEIQVISSFGTGETDLSAFDNALYNAGVHNYNLIILSSIIPKGTTMKKVALYTPKTNNEWGHRLYCVKWDVRSRKVGEYIASGLGWYQKEDKSGVLVEHQSAGFNKESVEKDLLIKIEKSIKDLCKFRNIPFDKTKMNSSYALGKVVEKSCCVLSVAVFQAQGWNSSFGF